MLIKKRQISTSIRKVSIGSAIVISSTFLIVSCVGDGSPSVQDTSYKTEYESTQGVITKLKEVAEPEGEYRIVDEELIADKSKSLAIVEKLDGSVDTVSLQRMQDEPEYRRSNSFIQTFLMYSLASSFFGRSMGSVSPNANYYQNKSAYDKSSNLKNTMKSTATPKRVAVPKSSSSGYGKGKSFRSFGG